MARKFSYTVFAKGSTNAHNSYPGVIDQVEAPSRAAAVADVLARIESGVLPEIFNGQYLSAVPSSQLSTEERDEVQYWYETGNR